MANPNGRKAWIDEHVCPICKKVFIAAPNHVYKTHTGKGKLVCSFTCDMKSLREAEAKKKSRSKGI